MNKLFTLGLDSRNNKLNYKHWTRRDQLYNGLVHGEFAIAYLLYRAFEIVGKDKVPQYFTKVMSETVKGLIDKIFPDGEIIPVTSQIMKVKY